MIRVGRTDGRALSAWIPSETASSRNITSTHGSLRSRNPVADRGWRRVVAIERGARVVDQRREYLAQQIAQGNDAVRTTEDVTAEQQPLCRQGGGELRKVAVEPPVATGADRVDGAVPVTACVSLGALRRSQIDVGGDRFFRQMDRGTALEADADHEHVRVVVAH